ncbi:MAG: hypothetical protein JWO13_821 [Acidobacteriales bacterium]|nr:hypothetical protein [Terriglobales bacterium]
MNPLSQPAGASQAVNLQNTIVIGIATAVGIALYQNVVVDGSRNEEKGNSMLLGLAIAATSAFASSFVRTGQQ